VRVSKQFRPWLWALVWLSVIAAVGVMVYQDQSDWRRKLLGEYWKKKYLVNDDAFPSILLIGDSLVGRSFPQPDEEPNLFGANRLWANIWLGGASYADFSEFFAHAGIHHDLIIINLATLAKEPATKGHGRKFRRYPKIVERYLLHDPIEQIFKEHYQITRGYCGKRDTEETKKWVKNIKNRYSFNKKPSDNLVHFLQSMKSVSRKVVVVELPRSELLSEKLGGSLTSLRDYFSPILESQGVEFVTLGGSLPEDLYCDGSHPNLDGRVVRRQQLINLVKEALSSTQ